jgi:hypothetical protein
MEDDDALQRILHKEQAEPVDVAAAVNGKEVVDQVLKGQRRPA